MYKSAVLNLWDNVVLLSVDLPVRTLTILEKLFKLDPKLPTT